MDCQPMTMQYRSTNGRFTKQCLALFIAAALAGCGGDPLRSSKGYDDAINVYPASYKTDIVAIARTYLNNPRKIRDAQISEPVLKPATRGERYVVCVRFDAMNSVGSFTGNKVRIATFRGGKLDQFAEAISERGGVPDQPAETGSDPCAGAVFQPFPELETLNRQ
jgi:hypothetical protein